jgi:DNA repair exonuclease SbcCD ATPase subunit
MDFSEFKAFATDNDEAKTYIQSLIDDATGGLKAKNEELLGKNKKIKEDRDSLRSEVSELSNANEELEELKVQKTSDVQEALEKQKKKFDKEIERLTGDLEGSKGQISKLLIDNGLNDALLKANIAKEHLPAVTALLRTGNNIEISTDEGDSPVAVVGDKQLGEFVSEWSQSDLGKLYVAAADNSGGGAKGSNGQGNASAENMDDMSPMAKLQLARSQGL